jgi:hypothetical protein
VLPLPTMRREANPLRRTLALLGAVWLLVAYLVTTTQAVAMICPEEAAPVAEAPPPCHGHTPLAPDDEPAPRSTECSPFCQLLCHGLAFVGQPTLTAPPVAAPEPAREAGNRPLPLLPDSIDHVPL